MLQVNNWAQCFQDREYDSIMTSVLRWTSTGESSAGRRPDAGDHQFMHLALCSSSWGSTGPACSTSGSSCNCSSGSSRSTSRRSTERSRGSSLCDHQNIHIYKWYIQSICRIIRPENQVLACMHAASSTNVQNYLLRRKMIKTWPWQLQEQLLAGDWRCSSWHDMPWSPNQELLLFFALDLHALCITPCKWPKIIIGTTHKK